MIKYFVTFQQASIVGGVSLGNDEIERETPISGIESIRDIEYKLAKLLGDGGRVKVQVLLLSFQRFE